MSCPFGDDIAGGAVPGGERCREPLLGIGEKGVTGQGGEDAFWQLVGLERTECESMCVRRFL